MSLPDPAPTVALATLAPQANQRRLAIAVVIVSAGIFLALAPFAKTPLRPVAAFIPIYETAVILIELITAVLLFGQFRVVQSRVLLILGSGYLFTAATAAAHLASFPGLFAPTGLLGANKQTTAWLYMFWHGGFPLVVIAYARLKHVAGVLAGIGGSTAVLLCVGIALALAGAATLLASAQGLLPEIMRGNSYVPMMTIVVTTVWSLSLLALIALWRSKPHSIIDLWLMVVMCVWMFEIALSAVLNAGRFDLGFYAGRIYGLLAASFVLIVLLLENGALHARLVDTHNELQRLATADPLTGIANRRALELTIDQEWRRALRTNAPLSLLMIDVDHFKRYNDDRGHVAGDDCLREVATVLSDTLKRAGDFAARYGGEEFAIILPDTPAEAAVSFAKRLSAAVDERSIPHPSSPIAKHVTISVGVTTLQVRRSEYGMLPATPTALFEAADRALYAAKEAGRRQVCGNVLEITLPAAA